MNIFRGGRINEKMMIWSSIIEDSTAHEQRGAAGPFREIDEYSKETREMKFRDYILL